MADGAHRQAECAGDGVSGLTLLGTLPEVLAQRQGDRGGGMADASDKECGSTYHSLPPLPRNGKTL